MTHLSLSDPSVREAALAALADIPLVPLGHYPTPLEPMDRLREAIGGGPRLLVKRDDAIPFAFGGNKVRKLQYVIADALAGGADTIITCGGVQSNHARATIAAARRHGLDAVLVANGERPDRLTANALLDDLMGAEVVYVRAREDRETGMKLAAAGRKAAGRRPCIIPLGASTPLGALGYVAAVGELLHQGPAPDVIVLATSSGGTQAGILAGCALHGIAPRVLGISADDPAPGIEAAVERIVQGIGELLGMGPDLPTITPAARVDDGFAGAGYGLPTVSSDEAQSLAARTEALFVDHTYTAKALGAVIAWARVGRFGDGETVLFWHTGGQLGLFA